LARPNNSKPKGRTIKGSEQKVFKLGAKGTKKMNRKCQKCGIADGHTVGHVCHWRRIEFGWLALLDVREDDLLDLGTRLEVTLLIGMRQQHQKTRN
jgi:hypothetical protein